MTTAREIAAAPLAVPASIAPLVAGRRWTRDLVGEAGASVHRLAAAGRPDLYLKHGAGEVAEALGDEMVRMRWLARHMSTPSVAAFVFDESGAWLLMSAVDGRTAYDALAADPSGRAAIVDALGSHLRRLHALPLASCPFDSSFPVRLARARERIDAGLVDEDDFGDAHAGWTAEQVWTSIHNRLPVTFDRVVTHGDLSLGNIMIADGRVAGVIDLGRVGVADRYQDLAILWDGLGEFDPVLQERLFAAYGIDPDRKRIALHLMLDELF